MTRSPSTPDCAIKDCSRAAHTGLLCKKHYELVPHAMVTEKVIACFAAQMKAASQHNRKQLRFVRGVLSATGSAEPS